MLRRGAHQAPRPEPTSNVVMNQLVLFAAAEENPVTQIARTFGVDWTHLIAQLISFGIVCAILYKFAYRRVLTMLEERRQQIAEGLANAEKIKAELARTEAQRQEIIVQVNAQAVKLLEEARAAAARVQEQETQKAIAAAEQIIAKAREAAAQDHARMLAELKREVGRLVVQTTATVTGKILTPEDQRRLAEETSKVVAT
jgi:F-type H+-transporting ATPase subunit b